MPRRRNEKARTGELLDELLEHCGGHQVSLGQQGLFKQLTKSWVKRVLSAD